MSRGSFSEGVRGDLRACVNCPVLGQFWRELWPRAKHTLLQTRPPMLIYPSTGLVFSPLASERCRITYITKRLPDLV
jgi:hypothetical protein